MIKLTHMLYVLNLYKFNTGNSIRDSDGVHFGNMLQVKVIFQLNILNSI